MCHKPHMHLSSLRAYRFHGAELVDEFLLFVCNRFGDLLDNVELIGLDVGLHELTRLVDERHQLLVVLHDALPEGVRFVVELGAVPRVSYT